MKTTLKPRKKEADLRNIANNQAKVGQHAGQRLRQSLISSQKRIFPKPSPEPGRRVQVGSANDPAEREADLAAEQVLRGGKVSTGHADTPAQPGALRMKANSAALSSSKGGMDAPASVEAGINSKRGQGGSLPEPIQQKLSHTFGTDFSGVRVHTDSAAHDMNAQLRAKAFTQGSDMFFGKGQYAPGTAEGDRLIAHEAAHVVQQQPNLLYRKPLDTPALAQGPVFEFLEGGTRLKNALENLNTFFPRHMEALQQFNCTIQFTEGNLEGDTVGAEENDLSPIGDLNDYYFQTVQDGEGNAIGGYLPKPSKTSPSSLSYSLKTITITIDVRRIEELASIRYKNSVTKVYRVADEFEKLYFSTMAHELLGHALFALEQPAQAYAFKVLKNQGMLKPGFPSGHHPYNPSGQRADAMGTAAEEMYFHIYQDQRFKHIVADIR